MHVPSVYPSRAAERVVFRELFTDYASVHRNGGTLIGSPTVKDGVTLDGSTQYVTYGESGRLASPVISFVAEFVPTFSPDDSVAHFIFDSPTAERYALVKSSSDQLQVVLGGQFIGGIVYSSWSAYWRAGERNTIVVASESGDTDMWLNGNKIMDGDVSIWTPKHPQSFRIGAPSVGLGYFSGVIHSVSAHSRRFTAQDVAALEAGTLWTYQNRALCYFDMKEQTGTQKATSGEDAAQDGDMEAAGTASWIPFASGVPTKVTDSPYSGLQCLRITSAAGITGGVSQPLAREKFYRLRGRARGDGANKIPKVYLSGGLWEGTNSTAWQYFDVVSVKSITPYYVLYCTTNDAGYVDFDDLTVVEVDNLLSDGDMESDGLYSWFNIGTGTISKETTDPYSGTQVIRSTNHPTVPAGNIFKTNSLLVVGGVYRVRGRARSSGGGVIPRLYNAGIGYFWIGSASTSWQEIDVTFIATNATVNFYNVGTAVSEYTEWDAMSIEPVYARTLDKSPHGHTLLLGDGVTPADKPDFKNPGFYCPGSNAYMTPDKECCPATNELSVALQFRPGFHPTTTTQRILWDTDTASATRFLAYVQTGGGTLSIYIGGVVKLTILAATYLPHWRENTPNVLILSAEQGLINAYLNGALISTIATTFTPKAPLEFFLGRTAAGATDFLGEYLHFSTYEFALSPMQIHDLTVSLGGVL